MTLADFTVANNSSALYGGNLYFFVAARITAGTFAGDAATSSGGAICSSGTLRLPDVKFSGNASNCDGGAVDDSFYGYAGRDSRLTDVSVVVVVRHLLA